VDSAGNYLIGPSTLPSPPAGGGRGGGRFKKLAFEGKLSSRAFSARPRGTARIGHRLLLVIAQATVRTSVGIVDKGP